MNEESSKSDNGDASSAQKYPQNVRLRYMRDIDRYFDRLSTILQSVIKDPNVLVQSSASDPSSRIGLIYDALTEQEISNTQANVNRFGKNGPYPTTPSFIVIAFFCQALLEIRELIQQQLQRSAGTSDERPKDLIEISLNDMKIFNTVVTIIIIDGIYPTLSPGVGVPLALRVKNRQNLKAASTIIGGGSISSQSPPTQNLKFAQLSYILEDTFIPCLKVKDDVRDLIFIGSYFPDLLAAATELAFNPLIIGGKIPAFTPERKVAALRSFQFILSQMDTYSLFLNLTSLIRPKAPTWIISATSKVLATLPLSRPTNGVLSLIEFISGIREQPEINIQDLDKAIKVLKSVPAKMDPSLYFKKIGKQLITILSLDNRQTTVSATVHIVSSIYDQKKDMIITGVQTPLIETISPFRASSSEIPKESGVIVKDTQLDEALCAFAALLRSAQPLAVIHEVGKLCFVSLWAMLCYSATTKKPIELTKSILVAIISLQPEDSQGIQKMLIRNFLKTSASPYWEFGSSDEGNVEIRTPSLHTEPPALEPTISRLSKESDTPATEIEKLESQLQVFGEISARTKVLSECILVPLQQHFEELNTKDSFTSSMFVHLVKEWLSLRQTSTNAGDEPQVKIFDKPANDSEPEKDDTISALVNAKLLEMLYTNHKDSLLKSPVELLMVIHSTLEDFVSTLEQKEAKKVKVEKKPSGLEGLKIVDLSEESEEEEYYPDVVKNIAVIEDVTDEPVVEEPKEEEDEDAEEILDLCFSLVLAIAEDLSAAKTQKEDVSEEESGDKIVELRSLEAVVPQLQYIIEHTPEGLLQGKAASCVDHIADVLELYFPDEVTTANVESDSAHKEKQALAESRKQLSKAIKLLDDPLVPIQANGLYILRTLIDERSPAVANWQMVCQIYLSKLKSEDSFIYLNAVKGLFALCDKNGQAVIDYLVGIYVGVPPKPLAVEDGDGGSALTESYTRNMINSMTVDEHLKLGEVILKSVQRLGQALDGAVADSIAGNMIQVVSKRKIEGSLLKDKEYPDLLRMSAMSVLGAAFEANFLGLFKNWLHDALDCVLGVLQMEVTIKTEVRTKSSQSGGDQVERDNEQVEKEFGESGKVLMRRAAISLVGSIVKNVPSLSLIPSDYLSKLSTQLGIASHDDDPLIRSQATTVMSIIDDLQMS